MNLKKRLLTLALCLTVLLGTLPTSVLAETADSGAQDDVAQGVSSVYELADDTETTYEVTADIQPMMVAAFALNSASNTDAHTHCICGGTTNIGDHTTHTTNTTWTAWDGTDTIAYDTNGVAYVYLTDDATRSSSIEVTSGETLNLCLNGKTLSRSSTVITVTGNATLNICDCKGGGGITSTNANAIYVETLYSSNANTVLNLYGGKISTSDNSTVCLKDNYSNDNLAAIFNMYGGEVYNSADGRYFAVGIEQSGSSSYKINIYGGSITSENSSGISTWRDGRAETLVAGGTIKGKDEIIDVLGNLTLSGSPTITHTGSSGSDIDITTTNVAETDDDYIVVKDNFAPVGTISVEKSVDSSGSVVIATPAASDGSLSDKARYFVSSEEGYFVECNSDGNLQLSTCAITDQPTASNQYTVTASGGNANSGKVTYQWYKATSGTVAVTDKNATAGTHSGYRGGGYWDEWYTSMSVESGNAVTWDAFTLPMSAGDKLTVKYQGRSYGGSSQGSFNSFTLTGNGSEVKGETGSGGYYTTKTFTAPADGEYTLKVTATPGSDTNDNVTAEYNLYCSFSATVTADVADETSGKLDGQTATKLTTTELAEGKYICAVTWEGKTTLYSNAVTLHTHSWGDWTSSGNGTHSRTCTGCNDTETQNCSGGTATCTSKATCTTCHTAYGEVNANNHKPAAAWTQANDKHYHVCENGCSKHLDETACSGGTATCTAKAVCAVCQEEYGEVNASNHSYGAPTYTWSSDNKSCTAKRVCTRANCNHEETQSATVEAEVTQQPSCTETELTTYTATFTNTAFAAQTKPNVVTKNNLGHDFTVQQSDATQHWKKCSRCNEIDTKTNHAWGAWSSGTRTCSVCSYKESCSHNWDDGKVTTAPTCTAEGVKTFTCSVCGSTKTETVEKTAHNPGTAVTENEIAATCTKAGSYDEVVYCSVCKAELSRENKSINALGHDTVAHEAKAATCTAIGWDAYETCQRTGCGYTTKVEIPAKGHSMTHHPAVAATCVAEGNVEYWYCSTCQKNFKDAQGDETLDTVVTAIDPNNHDRLHHEAQAATCTEKGWNAYETCQRTGCGYTTKVEIPAKGHSMTHHPAVAATCVAEGNVEYWYCSTCQKNFKDAQGDETLDTVETAIDPANHAGQKTWATTAATHAQTWDCCKVVVVASENHEWENGTCTECGYKCLHSNAVDDGNCLTAIVCPACGRTTKAAETAHAWGRYVVTEAATTSSAGVETRDCQHTGCEQTQTRAIAKLTPTPVVIPTYTVSGTVHDSKHTAAEGVTVHLVLGDRQIAEATTDASGAYRFDGVTAGVYNLVAELDGAAKTIKVEVRGANVTVNRITMPEGTTSSVVEVKTTDETKRVDAAVGNLEELFTLPDIFTEADKEVSKRDGGSVEIKLTVTREDEEKTSAAITEKLEAKNEIGMLLDLTVNKTITRGDEVTVTNIPNTGVLLEATICLPDGLQGKGNYTVYRLHGGEVNALTTAPNAAGEYITIGSDKRTVTIHAKYFSEYVIAYREATAAPGRAYITINTPAATAAETAKSESANTFDAGIGVYTVSAVLSIIGMAWAGKKKH